MSFFIYIFLFLMLNSVMRYSPALGMLLYVGLIVFVINNNRKRMRAFQQRQYQQQAGAQYQNNQYQNTQSQTSSEDVKRREDAIDVEFSEEEIE